MHNGQKDTKSVLVAKRIHWLKIPVAHMHIWGCEITHKMSLDNNIFAYLVCRLRANYYTDEIENLTYLFPRNGFILFCKI